MEDMYYKKEFNVNNFEFHGEAAKWVEEFREKGMLKDLESAIEEIFHGEIPTAGDINDLVWFDEYIHSLVEDASEEDDEDDEDEKEDDE